MVRVGVARRVRGRVRGRGSGMGAMQGRAGQGRAGQGRAGHLTDFFTQGLSHIHIICRNKTLFVDGQVCSLEDCQPSLRP